MSRPTPVRGVILLCVLLLTTTCSAVPSPAPVSPAPTSSTTPGPATPSSRATDIRTVIGAAGFVSPSGGISCLMSSDLVTCEFHGDKSWTGPQPDGCELDWGSMFDLRDVSRPGCTGNTIRYAAAVGSDTVTWHRAGDPTVSDTNATLAGLPYGSAIALGTFRCDSATTGVTCRNTATTHGFTMSREAYSIF